MQNITIIAKDPAKEMAHNSSISSQFRLTFLPAGELTQNPGEARCGDLTLLLPWPGFSQVLASAPLTRMLSRGAVLVLGPYSYFSEVEDLLLAGALTFVASPTSPETLLAVLGEMLRTQNLSNKNKETQVFPRYSAAS
jgi:hypothetical protein